MAFVPGGTFQVGIDASEIPRFQKIFEISTSQLFQDEIPKHSVTLNNFYIDKTLVTNAQFRVFVAAALSGRERAQLYGESGRAAHC